MNFEAWCDRIDRELVQNIGGTRIWRVVRTRLVSQWRCAGGYVAKLELTQQGDSARLHVNTRYVGVCRLSEAPADMARLIQGKVFPQL